MSKHYKPVSLVTAADINRANQERWGGGEATFSESSTQDVQSMARDGRKVKISGIKPGMSIVASNGSIQTVKSITENKFGRYNIVTNKGMHNFGPDELINLYEDAKTRDSLSESEEREYRRLSNTSNRTSEEQRRLAELSRKKAVLEYGDSEGTEALRSGLNEFLAEEEQEPEHETQDAGTEPGTLNANPREGQAARRAT